MRLLEVRVEQLFGIFDHKIALNDEHITIVHGPNGFGKTVILNLIHDLLRGRYYALRKFPFSRMDMKFDNSHILSVQQFERTREGNCRIEISLDGDVVFENNDKNTVPNYSTLIALNCRSLVQIDDENWVDDQTGTTFDLEAVLRNFQEYLPPEAQPENYSERLKNFTRQIKVVFVKESRTRVIRVRQRPIGTRLHRPARLIVECSNRLRYLYDEKHNLFFAESSHLANSFAARLIREDKTSLVQPRRELTARLEAIGNTKRSYENADLLRSLGGPLAITEEEIGKVSDGDLAALSLYVEDEEYKLTLLYDFFERLDLFQSLVNERLSFKTLTLNQSFGFQINAKESGDLLQPEDLSSGEQHQVVLLFELLFESNKDTLILVDEPEISLHVAWQKKFVKDLRKIIELTGVDILIATHSPQIIGSNWSLTVQLERPEE